MRSPFHRPPRAVAAALLTVPILALGLAACDGDPLRELNRGVPTRLELAADTSGFGEAVPGETLPVAVVARDPYGDGVPGAIVTWAVATGAGASVNPDSTFTDADGLAGVTWTLGGASTSYTLQAVGASSSLTFTADAR